MRLVQEKLRGARGLILILCEQNKYYIIGGESVLR